MIAYDIDGCFLDLCSLFSAYAMSKFQTNIKNVKHYDLTIGTGLTKDQVWKAIEWAYRNPEMVPIYEGAEEVVRKTYELTGEPILFITARPASSAHQTHETIRRFCDVPYLIAFANDHKKIDYLTGKRYFVDDRRRTAIQLAKHGLTVFMPRRSYNELSYDHDGIIPIDGIHELVPFLDELMEAHNER